MVIGVAGGYCAGKDTVVRILAEAGFPSIDVDAVGHGVLASARDEVLAAFGPGVLDGRGEVDRRALGRLVFADPAQRARLEAIVHPRMCQVVAQEVERHGRRCVVNAAILFRMGLHELCDVVICVRAPLLLRLVRAGERWRRRAPGPAAGGGAARNLPQTHGRSGRYSYCTECRKRRGPETCRARRS